MSTIISAQAPDSMLLTAARELSLDLTNQGGVQKLYSIKDSLEAQWLFLP
ncbi:hypothetical protein [Arthrobacter sp. STN4]|nr:hypothetical protein [Arthrobacter sp. STN4]MCQ9165061.1 hypothetical protein [Arthrobacter sp. STN4]